MKIQLFKRIVQKKTFVNNNRSVSSPRISSKRT